MTMSEPTSSTGTTFRRATPADASELAEFMARTRAHYAGARHRAIYRAIVADSICDPPRILTTVAVEDGRLVGFVSAIRSDSRRYWASLVVRHPGAALAILRHRLKKLTTRLGYRRRNRSNYDSEAVLVPNVEVPPEVAERLAVRPPATGSPRPGEHGEGIALGLFMAIAPEMRGRRLGVRLFERLFEELRATGARRYDCSFSLNDPAAIKMHCNYPFTIYRLPGGYWASLRLADLDG